MDIRKQICELSSSSQFDGKVANDLALLKADGRFACLPIAASRTAALGGTVATVGFPDIGLPGFAPKVLAHGHHGGNRAAGSRTSTGAGDDPHIFKSARSLQTATMQPGKWQDEHRPLVDARGNVIGIVSAKVLAHGHQAATALAASGALPENVNYAVKSREGRHVAVPNFRDADTASLPALESVPDVSARLKPANTKDEKFEDVVKSAQDAAVLVLVY